MPKQRKRRSSKADVPAYMRHKSGGRDRAFCYVMEDGARRRVYLGPWGSAESKRRFRSLIGSHLSEDRPKNQARRVDRNDGVTVEELVARFLAWGETPFSRNAPAMVVPRLLRSWKTVWAAQFAATFTFHTPEKSGDCLPTSWTPNKLAGEFRRIRSGRLSAK